MGKARGLGAAKLRGGGMGPILAYTSVGEAFNEYVAGDAPAVLGIVLIIAVLILWAWWRFFVAASGR
jgi:hypothetical protein